MKKIYTTLVITISLVVSFGQIPTSNLSLWLRADAGVTTTVGNAISAWQDQSPFNVPISINNTPRLATNQINGMPVVSFAGSAYFSTNNSSSLVTPTRLTYFVVCRYSNTNAAGIFSTDANNYGLYKTAGGNTNTSFYFNASTLNAIQYPNTVGTNYIYSGRYDLSSITGSINTTVVSGLGFSSPINAGGNTFYIGYSSFGGFLNGSIAELIIYNAALNTTQQNQVYEYLSAKYNVGIHPNAPQVSNFGTSNPTFDPLLLGTKVAASGFGGTGDDVTISGTNFTGTTQLFVNNISITGLTVNSNNLITFTLPDGLDYVGQDFTGKIKLVNSFGPGFSAQNLQVIYSNSAPVGIISVARGGQFVIEGSDLNQLSAISVGGINVPFTYSSITKKITVNVTTLVGLGNQTVRVRQATTIGNLDYDFADPVNVVSSISAPTITSISPNADGINSTFNIVGTNFGASSGDNVVYLGAVRADVVSNTSTTGIVRVPAGANYQSLSLVNLNSGLQAYYDSPFVTTFLGAAIIGTGTFATPITPSSSTNSYITALGDLDGNGKPELISARYTSSTLLVNINTTNGSLTGTDFNSTFSLSVGANPYDVEIVDIDNDGKLDIVVSNFGSTFITILKNIHSSGTLSAASFVQVNIPTTSNVYGLAVGDIDRDGRLDLVAANNSTNNLQIYKNIGTTGTITASSFATAVTYGIGSGTNPYDVELADLNNDGKLDIITANFGQSYLTIFENISSNGFINASSLNTPISSPIGTISVSVKKADIDGDGKMDLVAANYSTNTISVVRNKYTSGSILGTHFNEKTDFTVGTTPYKLSVGDINGDGKLDIAVANLNSSTMSILSNSATLGTINGSSFATKVDFSVPNSPVTPAVGDLNGDGKPEVVIGRYSTSLFSIFENLLTDPASITGFTPTSGLPLSRVTLTGSNFANVSQVRMGTITGGTIIEKNLNSIVVRIPAGATSNQIILVNNSGTQATSAGTFIITGVTPFANITSVSPINAALGASVIVQGSGFDATPNLNNIWFGATKMPVIAASANQMTVSVTGGASSSKITYQNSFGLNDQWKLPFGYLFSGGNLTNGSFTNNASFNTGIIPYNVISHDLDGDGKPDLIATNYNYNTNNISIIRNNAINNTINGTSFSAPFSLSTSYFYAFQTSLGDLDGDGKPEIVVPSENSLFFSIFKNNSTLTTLTTASFGSQNSISSGSYLTKGSAIADIDNDGFNDLIFCGSNQLQLYRNLGNGLLNAQGFQTLVNIPTNYSSPSFIQITDIDGDRKKDIILGFEGNNYVSIYRNISTVGGLNAASFAPSVDLQTTSQTYGITFSDLNNDGKPDIIASNFNTVNQISIFQNNANVGSITASNFIRTDLPTMSNGNPAAIHAGDLDGDGKPEIVLGYRSTSNYSVFKNNYTSGNISTSHFNRLDFTNNGSQSFGIELCDLDLDGKQEIITANNNGSNGITVYKNQIGNGIVPTITGFTPTSGLALATFVTVSGSGFTSVSGVTLANNPATYTLVNSTTLILRVPNSTISGKIGIANSFGTVGLSSADFTVTGAAPIPRITNITPYIASVGSSVVITGTGFDTNPANNKVNFGAMTATVTGASSTSLNVNVPSGATFEAVRVTNLLTGLVGESFKPFVTTFPSSGTITGATFAPRVDIAAETNVHQTILADLDGDGRNDMLSVNYWLNTFSVYRSTGTGSNLATQFASRQNFTTGSTVYKISTGDIDGDGRLDVVVVNYGSNTISVFRNISTLGNINFSAKVDFSTGTSTNPSAVELADLNKDGALDILISNYSQNYFSVFRNNNITGTITSSSFGSKQDFPCDFSAYGIAVGDIDKDGLPDVAVSSENQFRISVFRNTSSGGNIIFSPVTYFSNSNLSYDVKFADIDGDNNLDLISCRSSFVSVYRNLGVVNTITNGSFGAKQDFTVSNNTEQVTIIDIDGDGKLDITSAPMGTQNISVLRNTATLGVINSTSFASKIDFQTFNTNNRYHTLGDIDGDGKPEMIVPQYNSGLIGLFKNLSSPAPTITGFSPTSGQAGVDRVTLTGEALASVSRISIGGGVTQSIISANNNTLVFRLPASATTGQIIAQNGFGFTGTSTGTFTISSSYPYPSISGIAPIYNSVGNSVSINGTNFSATAANNVVYFGAMRATVTGASTTNVTASIPAGATYDALTLLNRDNGNSLTGANYLQIPSLTFAGANTINGNTFAPRFDINDGNGGQSSSAADFDGDGRNDIVIAYNSQVKVYRNTSINGTLAGTSFVPSTFNTFVSPFDVATADIDNDGRLDIIVGNQSSNSFVILRNISSGIGNIAFAPSVSIVTSASSTNRSIGASDIDLDGYIDIILNEIITGSNRVTIYRNAGLQGTITGNSFTENYTLVNLASVQPNDFEIADLTGDNYPEITIITNQSFNNINIFRNQSQAGFLDFATPTIFNSGIGGSTSIKAADFDNDGKRDLAFAHQAGSTSDLRFFRNTSTLTSISGTVFNFVNTPSVYYFGIDVGDVDGNGKIDVVGMNSWTSDIRVYRNISSASGINQNSFSQSVGFPIFSTQGFPHLADFTGDGRPEVFQFNTSGYIFIWRNQISEPATITGFAPNPAVAGVSIVTVSGVGLQTSSHLSLTNAQPITILGANATSFTFRVPANAINSVLTVANLTGGLAVSAQVLTLTAFPYPTITSIIPLKAAQGQSIVINGNNFGSTVGQNLVYFGNTRVLPSAASETQLTVNAPFNATYNKPRVVNVTNALSTDFTFPFTQTFTGLSTITNATFAAPVNATALSNPFHVAIGDIDGDGKPDAVSTSYLNGFVSIHRNVGNPGTWTGSSFATRVDINVGGYYLFEVKLADFDNDGKLDIALVNYNNSQLFILKNSCTPGNIAAANFSQVTYSTGANPYSLSVADFDNDGKIDIITGNYSANTLSIFRNNGIVSTITSASFTKLTDISAGGYTYQLEATDLNDDGKLDLVSANYISSNFTILQNNSTPENISFRTPITYSESSQPVGVKSGDIDGDGKLDLLFSGYSGAVNVAYRNVISVSGATITGTSFINRTTFAANANPYGLDLGDLDGDGKVDMVSANYSSANISIYRNVAALNTLTSTSFSTKLDLSASTNVSYPQIADMDLDGFPDIVVPSYGSNQISVYRLNLSSTPTATGFNPTSASPLSVISIAGFNLNSINQVAFGGVSSSIITVVGSTGILVRVPTNAVTGNIVVTNSQGVSSTATGGVFTVIPLQYPTITGISPLFATVGNTIQINGNNFSTSASNNVVYLGAVVATVTSATINQLTVTVPQSADYGMVSVLNLESGLGANYSIPLRNTFAGSGTIVGSSFANAVNSAAVLSQPYFSFQKDLNGDGKPEILVANVGSNYITIFTNNTSGNTITGSSFTSFNIVLTGVNPYHVVAEDLDNDGKPDLAIADYASNRIALLKNNYSGGALSASSFDASPKFFTTGSNPQTLAIGDIDFDGFNDIVVANTNSSNVSVFKNNITPGQINTNSFAAKQDFTVASSAIEIALVDLDNDGKLDIVTSNSSSIAISILKNTANSGVINASSFAPTINFSTPYSGYGLSIGDLNNDGKPEILTASSASAFVMCFQNNTSGNTITGTSFTRIDIAAPIYGNRNAKIADFDGDGKNDFVVATGAFQESVYRNISTGVGLNINSFATRVNYTTQTYPWGLSVGDLDGDFKPEIVSVNYSSNSISILKNLQSGSNPTITSLNPTSVIQGGAFTINGTNFAGITSLSINGISSLFSVINSQLITATVAGNATTGLVSIAGFNGTAVSPSALTVIPFLVPTITGFNPSSALPNAEVSVLGNNFVSITGISISGISAPFIINNSSLIIITVPSAITGKASIINYSGQTQSLTNLQILTNAGADFGRMLVMDGNNNQISIPDGNEIDFTNSFTFETMVKFNQITRATNGFDWQALFTKNAYTQAYGLMLQTGTSQKTLRLYLNGCSPSSIAYDWTNDLRPNIWYHVGATYNGSAARIYINGLLVLQQAVSGNISTNTSNLILGASPANGPYPLDGEMDEVRFWNIERNITGLQANKCAEINGNEANLFAYYRFNENASSTTALDASPSGLHALAQNFTLPTERPISTAKCYQPATVSGLSPNPIVGNGTNILTVSGLGFTDILAVRLGNFNLPNFTVLGNNIFVQMPITVTNANLIVVNGTETSTSTGILTVTGLIPTYTSISPNAERRGRIITISGTNFTNISYFGIGNATAPFSIINSSLIVATVSGNASVGAGVLTITNLAGNGFSNFTVSGTPSPSVTGVSPSFAINGNTINITLDEIEFLQNPLTIGGAILTNYTLSGNNLSFVVPFAATTGHVRVRTLYGGISPTISGSLLTILPPPTISDFGAVSTGIKLASSGCGGLGELVTISGIGFAFGLTDLTLNNFNVLNPTVTSENLILVRVPDLSGSPNQNLTGKFKITTPAGSVTSLQNMVARFCASTPTTTLGIKNNDDFEVTGNDLVNVTAVSVAGLSASFNTNASKLTVIVPNLAPSGLVKVHIAQGSYIFMFPFDFYIYPKPTITGILGSPALEGATISIVGSALSSTTGIAFNGANQTIVSNISDNLVTLTVPVSAANGNLNLTAIGGVATSPQPFVIAPKITGVLPTAAGVGRAVTLSGSGLNSVSQVLFNGSAGSIQSKTATRIIVNVPNGATSGDLTARITNYTTPGIFFRIIPAPTISNIQPGSAIAGTVLTISGTGFSASGINTLSFNNTGNGIATIISDNLLVVSVPGTASSGYLTLSNLGGSTTSDNQFLAIPSLSGEFNPYGLGAGGTITIFGNNLFNPTLVSFNNNLATTFSFQTANQLIAVIPNISSNTPIQVKVTTDGGTSNIALYTIAGAPSITSIAPGSGKAGDVITVNGDNFSLTSNTVLVNGANANHVALSKTLMLVTVPGNCTQATGNVQVQNVGNQFLSSPNNFANSPSNFAVIPSFTAIRNICDLSSVTSAVQGALLRIEGANFIVGNTQVFFNTGLGSLSTGFGICNSQFTSFSSGLAFAWVPNSATTGNVTVKTNGGTSNPIFLTIIPPPIISGFSPLNGVAGTVITILGAEFYTVSGVSLNSISAPFSQLSQTSILATISGTMSKGKISISATGGSASSNLDFAPTPMITSISPIEAPINSFINLNGTNLYGASNINFAGNNAINWNDGLTSTSVRVPINAVSGIISYTNAGGTAVSPIAFTVSTILGMSTNTGIAGTLVTISGNGLNSATLFSFASTSQFPVLGTVTGGVVVSVPGAATFGAITLHFPNGGSTSFGQFRPTPIITSISPNTHGTDQFINISGSNVWNIVAASFGGVLSNNLGFDSGSASAQIVTRNNVKVPTNGLTGIITITVAGGGVASSPSTFTVISIIGVLPETALAGTEIIISGANLDNLSGVSIGGTDVGGFTSTFSQIITTVPSTISSGQIIVSKDGGFNDSYSINLPDASITGINPTSGPIGTIITINGNNFTAARGVQLFNSLYNPFVFGINYNVISATRIVATVTGNGISGNIRVVGQNNAIATGGLFTMPPVLNTLPNPGVLPSGQTVVLNGGNLTAPTTINVGGIQVPVSNYGAGSISFVMPTLVGNNIITVGNSAGVSTVNFNFFSFVSLSTNTGFAGQTISISGTSFADVSSVRFNTTNATYTIINSQLITVTVPNNAGNGVISLVSGGYTINSTVFNPRPAITGFVVINGVDANTARLGSTVSLVGTNLNNINSVTLGGSSNAYSFASFGCTTGNDGITIYPLCVPNNANSGMIVANNGTYTASFAGFNFVSPPGTISGVAAIPGNQVTINGANLNTIVGVSFGGNEALSFTQISPTQVRAIVPFTATLSGTTQVRTQGGNTNSTYTAPPIITALSKTQGAVGIGVSVSALNIAGVNQVIFPIAVTATGTNNFANNISVNVPTGATNGFVSIQNEAGLGISPINFDVLPMPTISGISPSNGEEGTTVLINGTNLDLITSVFFGNGTQSALFTIISPTQISAIAPASVLTGKITIRNANVYPTDINSTADFVGSALFTSVINTTNGNASYIGKVGESIQINGANFTSPFVVSFGGAGAITTNFLSSSQVTAVVPAGATTGKITVSVSGGNFVTPQDFEVLGFSANPVAIVTNSCAGQTFRVNYSVTGFFPSDNIFYVDMMNGSSVVGSAIGNRAANNSGFVSAIIPAGLAGNYTARIRSASASTNYSLISANSNTINITNLNNWLGYTNDWNITSNWGCGVLPTAQSYVIIDNSPIGGNQPTIFGSATAGTVEVNDGQLTLTSSGVLTLFNDIKLSSTAAMLSDPTSFVLMNGSNATIVSSVGHAEVGNITIATNSKLTLGSALKVKGSFVNNVNTSYFASYSYGWYNIYGFNSNGFSVTVEGSNFQTVGNPGFYATLFDELVLNNNTTGAGVALAGPVQVKCKLINYGIFNANNFLTEFVNGPCTPQLIAESPTTAFDNILFNNTLTAVNITRPIRVRGSFKRAPGAQGITMTTGSGVEFVGTTAAQIIETAGQPLVFNDFKIDNPLGVVMGTAPGNDLEIKGNFINNGSFTDTTNTVSFSGANVTIGGTGEFNLNKVELTTSAGVLLKRAIRVRGSFRSKGSFNAGGQTITFNAPSGVQTIESTNPARLSGIEIVSTSVVTTSSALNINGNFDNAGKFVALGNTSFDGASAQTIAGAGLYQLNNVSVTNSASGVNIQSALAISGDLTTNGTLVASQNTELTFAGTNTQISGTVEPQLANININTSAGVKLNRSVRVRGSFKSSGTLTPNNQTVTFDANGGQTIESSKLVSFSGLNITPTAQVIVSTPLAVDGNVSNAGLYSTNQPTILNGNSAQTISGSGSFALQSLANNNTSSSDSVKVLSPISMSGNLENNGKLFSSTDIQFVGTSQTISGTVEPVLTNMEITPSASIALNRSVRVRGNFRNNSVSNGLIASAPVTLEGNSVQSITGTAPTAFETLNLKNNAGVIATNQVSVSGLNINASGKMKVPDAFPLIVSSPLNNAITRTDTGYVIGGINRVVNNALGEYIFPVGNDTQYRGATITFTGAASGNGSIAVNSKDAMPQLPTGQLSPLNSALQAAGLETIMPVYWNVDANNVNGGQYDINFDAKLGNGAIQSAAGLQLVKRHLPTDLWELVGNAGPATLSNGTLAISRTSISGFSQFAIAGACNNVTTLSGKPKILTIAGLGINNDTLMSNITGTSYQWSRNGVIVTVSGVAQKFKPVRSGEYRLTVFQNGCRTPISDKAVVTFIITLTGFEDTENGFKTSSFSIYPNPAKSNVTLEIENAREGKYTISIHDLIGKEQLKETVSAISGNVFTKNIDITALPQGIYFVKITQNKETKVLKLVID
ncbi:MAG: T9SS C-terminal target domain-containing protein [Bacteroidetes bacterium]|nr:MAG: T9SS C-terminal target domain-containing protein [Bacteroidota bacterium]